MKTGSIRTKTEIDDLSEKESIHTIGTPSEDSCEESDDDKEEATPNVGVRNGILKNNQTSCDKNSETEDDSAQREKK